MTATEITAGELPVVEHGAQLRRAAASTVGMVIEAHDFLLYGQAAGLVFAKLHFPASDPLVGTLQAFATYAVGFVARPIGAAIFEPTPCALLPHNHAHFLPHLCRLKRELKA